MSEEKKVISYSVALYTPTKNLAGFFFNKDSKIIYNKSSISESLVITSAETESNYLKEFFNNYLVNFKNGTIAYYMDNIKIAEFLVTESTKISYDTLNTIEITNLN